MLIVGSKALSIGGYNLRKPNDFDIICTNEEFVTYVKALINKHGWSAVGLENRGNIRIAFLEQQGEKLIVEASIVEERQEDTRVGSDWWLYYRLPKHYRFLFMHDIYSTELRMEFVTADVVLMMKLSHRYKKDSVHFHKTRDDILELRKRNIKLDGYLEKVLIEREKLTNPVGYKLNTTKKEFFTDNVPYKYDHDSLHRAVSYPNPPAYTNYMQEGAEVMCSKEKFFEQEEWFRLQGVFEEACVLALERAIIPHGTDPTRAFEIALEKVCTSITKGWFREYAWENYDVVRSMFNPDKLMGLYTQGLNRGTIIPFNQQ